MRVPYGEPARKNDEVKMEKRQICKNRFSTVWSVDDETYKKITDIQDGSGLFCISCFEHLARQKNIILYWQAKQNEYPGPRVKGRNRRENYGN